MILSIGVVNTNGLHLNLKQTKTKTSGSTKDPLTEERVQKAKREDYPKAALKL
jgi:hypothetical protein